MSYPYVSIASERAVDYCRFAAPVVIASSSLYLTTSCSLLLASGSPQVWLAPFPDAFSTNVTFSVAALLLYSLSAAVGLPAFTASVAAVDNCPAGLPASATLL